MGVFAQLGTVDQEALSRVLAANYRSMLVVLIVEDAACRSRLEQLMSKSRYGSQKEWQLNVFLCFLQPRSSMVLIAQQCDSRLLLPNERGARNQMAK